MLKRRRRIEEVQDLNLIPVMNLFVCLVPFLLLTAAFVQMGGVQAEMPAAQIGQLQESQKDQNQIVDLVFQIDGTNIEVVGFTHGFRMPIDEVQAKFTTEELTGLDSFLDLIHEKYPNWGSTLFKASSSTRFEDAILVLSKLRENKLIKNLVLAAEVVE